MLDMIKMVVVLTLLSAVSGGLLAAVRDNTKDRIEEQQLKFVKGPVLQEIFADASNDYIADRFNIEVDGAQKSVFVAVVDGQPHIALEGYGKGYGGDVGLLVGINLADDKIVGAGVTTHAETPGLGAKAKDDPGFTGQMKGYPATEPVQVTADGGKLNALSGATITSRAVASAASNITKTYRELKPQLTEKAKEIAQ